MREAAVSIARGDQGAPPSTAQIILLGAAARLRLRDIVLIALVKDSVTVVDLSGYPQWLVVSGGTLVVALGIWVLMKLLKLTLWLLLFVVLFGGLGWAGWLLIR